MFYCLFVLAFASPALSAVYPAPAASCSAQEFECGDGACVSRDRRCDGTRDCADGSDERVCEVSSNTLDLRDLVLHRYARQAACRSDQFRCRDGTCISFDGKCDGVANCPDHSDETHALCRNIPCQSHLFRCTYGACVDGDSACNGVQDCEDNSDELLPRCNNEVLVSNGRFTCKRSGRSIPSTDLCDGVRNCGANDTSDETLSACAEMRCAYSHLFQCAYGACVDAGANCNGKEECADGSDESDELCNRTTIITNSPKTVCVVPKNPDHGSYEVISRSNKHPTVLEGYESLVLKLNCETGFYHSPSNIFFTECQNGSWSSQIPKCIRYCQLSTHPSVTYYCGYEKCGLTVPAGSLVRAECNRPNYYRPGFENNMKCNELGQFDRVLTCDPGTTDVTIAINNMEIHVSGSDFKITFGANGSPPLVITAPGQVDGTVGLTDSVTGYGMVTPVTPEYSNEICDDYDYIDPRYWR